MHDFLVRRASRTALSTYESVLLQALGKGMKFTHADLWARKSDLSPEERELLCFLSMGHQPLVALVRRLADIGQLTDPRQKLVLAAAELGCEDVYQIYWYVSVFGPPLAV